MISSADDEEVLTTEAPESQLARAEASVINGVLTSQLVTIKDYSEHAGLVSALEAAGIIRIISRFTTGPFNSAVVLPPEALRSKV